MYPRGHIYAVGHDWGWSDRKHRRKKTKELVVTPGIARRAGIGRTVRFHDLRHTTASHLLMGSWVADEIVPRPLRLEEVREFLRHSDIAVTRRYAHLAADAIQSLALPANPDPECEKKAPSEASEGAFSNGSRVQFGVQAPVSRKTLPEEPSDFEPLIGLEPTTYGLRKGTESERSQQLGRRAPLRPHYEGAPSLRKSDIGDQKIVPGTCHA